MTIFAKTPIYAALALALSLATAPGFATAQTVMTANSGDAALPPAYIAVRTPVRPMGLTIGSPGQTADDGTFCGNADVFVFYEEDENGDPVPGTKEDDCTD